MSNSAMTPADPFTAPESEDAKLLTALLLDNINWSDGDTGTAVEAILTHFVRRRS